MPCHCLLGDGVALPAALKVVEDFELKFGHNVVMLCSNAIPNHRESLVEYSSFLGRKGLEILRFRDSLGYTGWVIRRLVIRHCVEELELGIGGRICTVAKRTKAVLHAVRPWQAISS
jgi:hypothetical protein